MVNQADKKNLRYYQIEAVDALLKHRYGLVELPTGAGKSEVILNTIERLSPAITLIVVEGKELLIETIKKVKDRFPTAHVRNWSSSASAREKKNRFVTGDYPTIIVSTYQSFSLNRTAPLLERVSVVFMDEAHKTGSAGSEAFADITKSTPWAYLRVGLTATPFKDKGETMRVLGNTGRVFYRKTLTEMVEEGFLARPVLKQANTWGASFKTWLLARGKTHKVIVFHETIKGVTESEDFYGVEAGVFTHGTDPERDAKLDAFKACIHGILFVTPIVDTGVDIPDCDTIVLREVRGQGQVPIILQNIQRIGRGLRIHKSRITGEYVKNKETLVVVHSDHGVKPDHEHPYEHGRDFSKSLYNALITDRRAFVGYDTQPYNLLPEGGDNT
jgi:superfamily II DNA or RNA helicase